MSFVLVFKAQIIVQDTVPFLTAKSKEKCELLQSQGIVSTHFHRA